MTRIGIFTDIHGNYQAATAILNDMQNENLADIYHLGDAIAIGPNPREILDLLIQNNVHMIRGNHEDYYLLLDENLPDSMGIGEKIHQRWTHNQLGNDYKEVINVMPYEFNLSIEKVSIHLCHYPRNDKGEFHNVIKEMTEVKADGIFRESSDNNIYCYGHYHKFLDIASEATGKRYINPGSAGAYHGDYTRYTIIEVNNNSYNILHKTFKYNKQDVVDEIYKQKMPGGEFIIKAFYGIEQ